MNFEKMFEELKPIYALEEFLKVKAPDKNLGNLYFNEEGVGLLEKYPDNPEFEKYEEDGEISFKVTIPGRWKEDAQGNLHQDPDRVEVFKVAKTEPYILPQQRPAESEKDFEEIYQREFARRQLTDSPEIHELLKSDIIEQVEEMIQSHQSGKEPGDRDLETMARANRFVAYLKRSTSKEAEDSETEKKENILENYDQEDDKSHHAHIFRDFGFGIWEAMYSRLGITDSSRADVKYIYEKMKYDGYIHDTVRQVDFLNWISETYEITVEKTSRTTETSERLNAYKAAKQGLIY